MDNDQVDRFLPFLAALDRLLVRQDRVTVAIEGGSAAGKSTLAAMLCERYDCTVFHMDDFFLRPEQRTPERFAEAGGNVDRERFLEEVLRPLCNGDTIWYRKFDCITMTLTEGERVTPRRLVVVEGAYAMHPELAPYYDCSLFLDIAPTEQEARLVKRNGPRMARRFLEEWIPLERVYFTETNVKDRCDMVL